MSKKFTYTKITGHYFCQYSNEWEEDGIEFDYEVENEKLLPVLIDLLLEEYFKENELDLENEQLVKLVKENLTRMVKEQDLIDILADNYYDGLKEVFQDEALEWYND